MISWHIMCGCLEASSAIEQVSEGRSSYIYLKSACKVLLSGLLASESDRPATGNISAHRCHLCIDWLILCPYLVHEGYSKI